MYASSPNQTPDPLYGVQLGAIRRQKVEGKALSLLGSPLLVHLGMMISGIVRDYYYPAAGFSAGVPEVLEEAQERLGIKTVFLLQEDEFTIAQPHRPEIADAAMGRVMQDHRVPSLGRHPHAAARTVLLKADFVHGPQFNLEVLIEVLKFFYKAAAPQGRHGQ